MAVTAAALVLVSCSRGGGDEPEGTGDAGEQVTLRFAWWGGDARHSLTQEVIDLFEAENPNITVSGEFGDAGGYWDRLLVGIAADDAPDIMTLEPLHLASFAEGDVLYDIDEVGDLDLSGIPDSALEAGVVGDSLYAVPVGVVAPAMVVNLDVLEGLGLELPDTAAWTWEEFSAFSAQVTQASDGAVQGFSPFGDDIFSITVWARQHGESLFADDGTVTISEETLAAYWQYSLDLIAAGATPGASALVEASALGLEQSPLATGQAAMTMAPATLISALTTASGANLALAELPTTEGGTDQFQFLRPSMFWTISSGTDHPAEAALFVDFLVNNEGAANLMQTERGIPANNLTRDLISDSFSATDAMAAEYLEQIQPTIGGGNPSFNPNGAGEIEAMMTRYYQAVLFGDQTPDEAAAAFIQELQGAVDDA